MSQTDRVFGIHAVSALLRKRSASIRRLQIAADGPRLSALRGAAGQAGVTVEDVTRAQLDALLPGMRHQGVCAVVSRDESAQLPETQLPALLEGLDKPAFLLVLDGVQDPHNLGACLRTADAAGVHAVILPRDRAAGITPVVHKVASGAVGSVPVVTVTNLARTLRMLRERGIWLFGAAGDADRDLHDAGMTGPLALVLGAEGTGLRRLTRELCDFMVSIPMAGRVESLNVSVATGILLYEARRQRRAAAQAGGKPA